MKNNNTHTIITANWITAERAKIVALRNGLQCDYDIKPTCIKKYHVTVTARTPEQDHILTLIILASTAHPEQEKYIKKLAEY